MRLVAFSTYSEVDLDGAWEVLPLKFVLFDWGHDKAFWDLAQRL